jgi:hypothetical protein
MTGPTWAILVPTIAQREELFARLLGVLLPQLDRHDGQVRVIGWRNVGEPRLAELRDTMVATAGTEYVSFVDDDDLVAPHFVDAVVEQLDKRPDHVGFKVAYCVDGEQKEIVDHSLRHGRWHRNGDMQLVRDFTHLDPIRREHAERGRFARAKPGRAEDRVWVKQVRPFLFSEGYADDVLYHYLWSETGTSWQRPELLAPSERPRPAIDHPYFEWHERSDP